MLQQLHEIVAYHGETKSSLEAESATPSVTCIIQLWAWDEPNVALFTAVPHMSVFTETEQTPPRPPGVAETQTSKDSGF